MCKRTVYMHTSILTMYLISQLPTVPKSSGQSRICYLCSAWVPEDCFNPDCPGISTTLIYGHSPCITTATPSCIARATPTLRACSYVYQRSNLNQSTIIALMTLKFNSDDCCLDTQLFQHLLSKCKKATAVSLGKQ